MSDVQVRVGILIGSDSDWGVMSTTVERLREFGIEHEVRVLSAHRSPIAVVEYVAAAPSRGVRVFIVGAGAAAHLGGVVAAHTTWPVIAVPLAATGLNGLDALLATVQMPAGVPVATMAIGKAGADNAAILAAQILALTDETISLRLGKFKQDLVGRVDEKNRRLQDRLQGKAGGSCE